MKMRKTIMCVLLVIAMLALAGCGASNDGTSSPVPGESPDAQGSAAPAGSGEPKTLRGTATVTPETLDPARGSGENDELIFVNIYETLVTPNRFGIPRYSHGASPKAERPMPTRLTITTMQTLR